MIKFFAPGEPVAKGSMVKIGKRFIDQKNLATKTLPANRLKDWQSQIAWCAKKEMRNRDVIPGAIALTATFILSRPKSHRNAKGKLKKGSPILPVFKPDTDKLLRAIGDAMSGIVYRDDCQIVDVRIRKQYVNGAHDGPGVEVEVRVI